MNMFNLFRLCTKDKISRKTRWTLLPKWQKCRNNVRLYRGNIQLCRKNRSTCSIRQCCFDIVAGVDGALQRYSIWTVWILSIWKQRSIERCDQAHRRKTNNQRILSPRTRKNKVFHKKAELFSFGKKWKYSFHSRNQHGLILTICVTDTKSNC